MTTFHQYKDSKDMEEKLQQAAKLLPRPSRPLSLSPVMAERCRRASFWRIPAIRMAAIVLVILVMGSTTIFAGGPAIVSALARFFSSGITEEPPIEALNSEESSAEGAAGPVSRELSGNIDRQTAGSLTLIQDVTLDDHFTASYASSTDYLTLEETPSGTPLFRTMTADGKTVYYSVADGRLVEIDLEPEKLTAAVQPGALPGIMTYGGTTEGYQGLTLPRMEFEVTWRQYGADILIDEEEAGMRFDIGSTWGVDLGNDYDGQFFYQAFPGREDMIQVLFLLDAQQTGYQYPFLLNLKTGEVSDPLALADLSGWDCITELSIQPDLLTAVAMAGSSHEDLRKITIDLKTGEVDAEEAFMGQPPADDCVIWFSVDSHTLFYVDGTEESGDGYLYDTQTGKSTVLFTDAASSSWNNGFGPAQRRWESIGYGYLVYFADGKVSLINLQDGGTKTALNGIPVSENTDFFMNEEASVLSISAHDAESVGTSRLCLLDLKTMEAWYFDRELPEGVEEWSNYWNGEYGFVIEAKHEESGMNYVYLYQYRP